MWIKSIKISEKVTLPVVISDKHEFLVPASFLLPALGMVKNNVNTSKFTGKIRNGVSFVENEHYVKYQPGTMPHFKYMKEGSLFLTKTGILMFCNLIGTSEAINIITGIEKQASKIKVNNSSTSINRLFRSILMDVCRIPDENLRQSIVNKLKELEIKIE